MSSNDNHNTPNHPAPASTPSSVSQAEFWQARYQQGYTGWDMGEVSPPLKAYIDHLISEKTDKSMRILVPGAGNAYEVAYLHEHGFTQVYLLDFAQLPLDNFAQRHPSFDPSYLLKEDFFAFEDSDGYDLIIEQTFFCAIDPAQRDAYVRQMHQMLKPTGKLVGLLFDTQFDKAGPPFGGRADEYRQRFAAYFDLHRFEPCHNSHPARQGRELFIELLPS